MNRKKRSGTPLQPRSCASTRRVRRPGISVITCNEFEIFFFVQGDVSYIVEQQVYTLLPGDILLFNNTEFHYPTFRSNAEFERIVLHFDPTVAQQFSTPRTPLLHRFLSRPQGEQNLVRLAPCERERFRALALSIEQESQSGRTGDDVLAAAHLSELLVLLARAPQAQPQAGRLSPYVRQALSYINAALPQPISLAEVGRALSVDRFYLEKTFKAIPHRKVGAILPEVI